MINNILYLDKDKMYSLSSQLFEGLTEYILKENNSTSEKSEEQKGPISSGRILADAMKLGERSVEKRFLHDYSLSLFEKKLNELDLVEVISSEVSSNPINISKSFIRISSKASFIDTSKISLILNSFNQIGEALTHVTNFAELDSTRKQIQTIKDSGKDKDKLSELNQSEKRLNNIAELAKQAGLYQDQKFLKNLDLVTKFGFSDQLEVQQRVGERLFSAVLKRDCLREADDLITRKYSRNTEKNLVVLGIVTQSRSPVEMLGSDTPSKMSMKEAVTNLVNHIANIETSLAGKSPNEVVVDPIAVYVTL